MVSSRFNPWHVAWLPLSIKVPQDLRGIVSTYSQLIHLHRSLTFQTAHPPQCGSLSSVCSLFWGSSDNQINAYPTLCWHYDNDQKYILLCCQDKSGWSRWWLLDHFTQNRPPWGIIWNPLHYGWKQHQSWCFTAGPSSHWNNRGFNDFGKVPHTGIEHPSISNFQHY